MSPATMVAIVAGMLFTLVVVMPLSLDDVPVRQLKIQTNEYGCLYVSWPEQRVLLPLTDIDGTHVGCHYEEKAHDQGFIPREL